jgi:hypothetical protein
MNTIQTAEEIAKSKKRTEEKDELRGYGSKLMRIIDAGYNPFITHKNLDATITMIENRERGYEPRCKTCNSKYLDKIEEMRDHEFSFDEIHDFLLKKGENISSMALSRHFYKHDPQKKEYEKYLKLKEEQAKQIDNEKIEDAIRHYGPLKYVFDKFEHRYTFEDKEMKYHGEIGNKEWFLKQCGYCTTTNRFCEEIPAGEVSCWYGVSEMVQVEFNNAIKENPRLDNIGNRVKVLEEKSKCYECHELYDKDLQKYLLHLILDKVLKLPINGDEFKYLYSEKCEYDPNEMTDLLMELKKIKR